MMPENITTSKLKELTDSSSRIEQGIDNLYNGATNLKKSLSYESYKATLNSKGINIDDLQLKNMTAILQSAVITIELQSLLDSIASIPGYGNNENYVNQVEQLNKQIENLCDSFLCLEALIDFNPLLAIVNHPPLKLTL